MLHYNSHGSKHKKSSIAIQISSLIAVFCLLASIAIVREGRIFGYDFRETQQKETIPTESVAANGQIIIDTEVVGKDIIGFNGPVPLKIYITSGRIDSVAALPNEETPKFFERASGLLNSWDGLTVDEAVAKEVDAVSGATYSSKAILGNFKAGMDSYKQQANSASDNASTSAKMVDWSIELTMALLVALAAAILPLFIKNKTYRLIQELLNVGVLGFWTGTFLDYSVFIRVFANGLPYTLASVLTLLLFVIAFIFPLFGRSNHYCSWVCPMGSAQELAGKLKLPKLQISTKTVKALNIFRNALWCILILCLWSGLLAYWTDYEIFSAFIIQNASTVVLITGGVFILLSLVIMRPFCRFVCPVGTLFHHSEGRN